MGCGARGIARGCLNLWLPLAPLAMDAFDTGLKATALEGEIKGPGEKKESSFSFSFIFFLFNQQRERRHHGNTGLLWRHAQRWRPRTIPPFLTEQHSANPAARPSLCLMYHSPVTSIACLAGRKIHSQAWISHCLLRGSGEGCEEERDAVNKPRLNRLLGAVQAEPH